MRWQSSCGRRTTIFPFVAYTYLPSDMGFVSDTRVLSVEKDGDAIASVVGRDTLTGRRTRYRAKLFVEPTLSKSIRCSIPTIHYEL